MNNPSSHSSLSQTDQSCKRVGEMKRRILHPDTLFLKRAYRWFCWYRLHKIVEFRHYNILHDCLIEYECYFF